MENNHSGNKTKEVILRKKGNKRKTINKKGRKILLGVFIGLVVLLLATLGGAYAIFKGYFNSTNYVKDDKVTVFDDSDISIELDGEGEQANAEDIAKVEADLQQNLETEIKDSKDVLNILLIGTDRRQENWHGNSDSIILASINRQKKQIILTSIMRDTYAAIPGSGNGKINRAHALGGGPLLVQTVEQNLKVDIDYYASVNFNGFMNVIDVIGGIPMYVSPAEVPVANMYIKEINRLNGLPETSGMLPESGTCMPMSDAKTFAAEASRVSVMPASAHLQACQTIWRAASSLVYISAIMKLMPWFLQMGLPKVSRTLEYSTAHSYAYCALPTAPAPEVGRV